MITGGSGVSFFTNCYEADWNFMLNEDGFRKLLAGCNFQPDFKALVINNVSDRQKVEDSARNAVREKIIDAYFFSTDYAGEILTTYNISRSSFVLDFYDGYWYSLGPLTAMHMCKTEYLLYLTGDCIMQPGASAEWITRAIEIFSVNDEVLVANPLWNGNIKEAEEERITEDDQFYYSQGFSDQCFMLPVSKIRKQVYGHMHPAAEMFPIYAGNTFERRLYSYMRVSGQYRITHKFISYIHDNEVRRSGKKEPFRKVLKAFVAGWKKALRVRTRNFFSSRFG